MMSISPEIFTAEKVDIHRHVEGSVFIDTLIELAENYGVAFKDSTIDRMIKNYSNDAEGGSLEKFIQKLSTRWMKLLIVKIMLSRPSNEAQSVVKQCIYDFYEAMVKHASKFENLKVMNILFSPRNLAVDADLSPESIKEYLLKKEEANDLLPEEEERYLQWIHEFDSSKGVTWEEHIETVGQIKNILSQMYQIKLILTASFRRDLDDEFLRQPTPQLEKIANILQRLFALGLIDIVDICGLESKKYKLWRYNRFRRQLDKRKITTSGHVGELGVEEVALSNQNLKSALQKKATWVNNYPLRIFAHAVGLARNLKSTEALLQLYLEESSEELMIAALNLSSNEATRVEKTVDTHGLLLLTFRMFFEESTILRINGHKKLPRFSKGLTSDDPTAFTRYPTLALQNELNRAEDAFNKFTHSHPMYIGTAFQAYKEELDQETDLNTRRLLSIIEKNRMESNSQLREQNIVLALVKPFHRIAV